MLNLSQKLSLEQKLTPQQILLSTLLQLPTLSLEMRIKQELEMNPVLEEGLDLEEIENDSDSDSDDTDVDIDSEEISEKLEKEEEIDWEQVHLEDDSYQTKLPKDSNEEEYERQDAVQYSIQEKLLEQLGDIELSEIERTVAEYLIWNISEDGYIDPNMKMETVAHIFDIEVKIVEKILKRIQRLEPKGLGSRNLRECLMVQLEDKLDETYLLAYDILRFAYDEFTNKRFQKIASIVDATLEEVKVALHLISTLNPKPGEVFEDVKMNYIIPDFFVEKKNDRFIVSLNDWNSPELHISSRYLNMLNGKDKKAKSFLRKKIEAAKWFINSIEQRKHTMLRVMNAIVEKQYDFFDKGPSHIKPLIMKEIAEIISMDISTVSRVSNGKYVQTESGEEVSTNIIKAKIKDLCDSENKQKPMSDENLSKELKVHGFNVARRTVAKYREQLGIPVARLRKEIV